MVVETILSLALTQTVNHYAPKALTWLDGKTMDLAKKAATGDERASENLAAVLRQQLEAAPVAGDDGSEGTLTPEKIVRNIIYGATDRDPKQLEQLSDVMRHFALTLDGTFRAVHELPGGMTATRGWFHTTDCVAVLNARSNFLGSFDPHLDLHEPPEERYFYTSDFEGHPAVTIVDCSGKDEVEEVRAILQSRLRTKDGRQADWSLNVVAMAAGVDRGRVRPMTRLFEDRIELGAPPPDAGEWPNYDLGLNDLVNVEGIEVYLGDHEGMKALKDDIVHQILALDTRRKGFLTS